MQGGCDHWNVDDDDSGVKLRTELEQVEQGGESRRPNTDGNVDGNGVCAASTSTKSAEVAAVAVNGVVKLQKNDNMNTKAMLPNDNGEHQTTTLPTLAHSDATLAAASRLTPTRDPTNPPSLHQACKVPAAANNDVGNADEDGRYSALCVPDIASPCDDGGVTTTRTVPSTCAICLIHYGPGNYVTWSSNGECCHVFHRDCILM